MIFFDRFHMGFVKKCSEGLFHLSLRVCIPVGELIDIVSCGCATKEYGNETHIDYNFWLWSAIVEQISGLTHSIQDEVDVFEPSRFLKIRDACLSYTEFEKGNFKFWKALSKLSSCSGSE